MAPKKNKPKVSVCVVTYNHERFIGRCVESLQLQTGPFELEIIVADDCSTDDTGEIVDRLAAEDRRIRVLRPARNIGVTPNLMAVHNAATGDLVAHLDGDDWAAPGKLAAQVALMAERPEAVACGHRMVFVDEEGRPNGHSYPSRLADRVSLAEVVRWGMPFLASSLMYRREARKLREVGFELFDWFFLTDILNAGPAAYLDEPLGFYTVNAKSLTASLKRRAMRERMLGLYARRLNEHPSLRADVFCYAASAALSCLKQRDPLTTRHQQLLARSFTPAALAKLPDTIRWHLGNAAALAR